MKPKIDVSYIANLARIKLADKDIKSFSSQLSDIISYIDKLNKVDTDNTPPTTHPISLKDVFREDITKPSLSAEKALLNAPDKKDTFFKVPKIIEDSL